MFKLLLDEPPLVVLPSLAVRLGLAEAIVLQQVHYWLQNAREMKRESNHFQGRWWMYNTYEEWQRSFPFWSERTIQRTILSLEEKELLLSIQPLKHRLDRRKWYSIDYEVYKKLIEPDGERTSPPQGLPSESLLPSDAQGTPEGEIPMVPDWHHRRRQSGTIEDDKVAPSNVPKRHARRRQSGTFFKEAETTTAETTAEATAAETFVRAEKSLIQETLASVAADFSPSERGEPTPNAEEIERVLALLVAEGVNRGDARRLATTDITECQRQLTYLPFVPEFKSSRGAYLRTAIEQGFAAPIGFSKAEKSREKATKVHEEDAHRRQERELQEEKKREIRAERERLEREEPEVYAELLRRADELLAPPIRSKKNSIAYRPALMSKLDELISQNGSR